MDIVLILLLILLNGVFAMSEMAVVSARKARLQNQADEGSPGAEAALALNNEPSTFLSTIQVGITSIGVLSGAIGETVLADPLTAHLAAIPGLEHYARGIALTIVVALITYLSVVVGELVPKRLALLWPEGIAAIVARPMIWLSRIARPLVGLLSVSSDLLLRLLGARNRGEPPVTDDEIKVLMEQGAEAGVFHESEQEIVSNVLRLDEQRIGAIMTPRKDIMAIDLAAPEEDIRRAIAESAYGRIVVCRDGMEHIAGVLQSADLLRHVLAGQPLNARDVEAVMRPPLYVPESVTTTQLLENFRQARVQFALIVDEYGELQGLVTLTDVLTSIVGEVSIPQSSEDQDIVQRADGSWLVDGGMSIERFRTAVDLPDELPGEEEHTYHTVGGFVMHMLGRVPAEADAFEAEALRFEVMDMDKHRVDKVLVTRLPEVVENGSK